ncbi:MAG: cytochrome b, partial [Gammaproteobacteria bacterium]|nr:cytochrome b [Gammaproteobacteria bacterium]
VMSAAGGYDISFFGWFNLPLIAENESLSDIAHETHEILGWLTILIILIHLLAALKHQFVNKDATLRRMLGRS